MTCLHSIGGCEELYDCLELLGNQWAWLESNRRPPSIALRHGHCSDSHSLYRVGPRRNRGMYLLLAATVLYPLSYRPMTMIPKKVRISFTIPNQIFHQYAHCDEVFTNSVANVCNTSKNAKSSLVMKARLLLHWLIIGSRIVFQRIWQELPDTTTRIWNVAKVARDKVDMEMRDSLSCYFSTVDSKIIAIGSEIDEEMANHLLNIHMSRMVPPQKT